MMKTYALLCHPGMNRVYAAKSAALCARELLAAAGSVGIPTESVGQAKIAGVDYLTFTCDEALSEKQLSCLARLSAFFALFERLPNGALLPVEAQNDFAFPDSLVTLLKYIGKTNEQFTHLMVHLALCACQSQREGRPRLLDPLCGRGTTLFTAMRFCLNCTGVEIRPAQVHEGDAFLTKYLQDGRYKHRRSTQKRSDGRGRKIADVTDFCYAPDKASFQRGDIREARFICADTLLAEDLLPKRRFDLLVADLPYGVQHGSIPKDGRLSRSAVSLVDGALGGWLMSLKDGASLVLAYNTLTTPKEALSDVLTRHGLKVLTDPGYTGYAHRVDQSINRDLTVARKPLTK